LSPSVERFVDRATGAGQRPFEQCGDMLVTDRDGNWSYQFAVTVDDMEQGVNLSSGDDLRHQQAGRFSWRACWALTPRFLHHGPS
jgi:glutamyl-tRNA synthetase/glutamyl-Q tRNA(Asp) synthetase